MLRRGAAEKLSQSPYCLDSQEATLEEETWFSDPWLFWLPLLLSMPWSLEYTDEGPADLGGVS